VNGYLIDTNAALIALADPRGLSSRGRTAIQAGPNVLSVAVYWEVVLKSMKGMLGVGEPRTWWLDALDQLAATSLDLRPEHITRILTLPPIHKDPFDRVLVAQAAIEELTLVTKDGEIRRYATAGIQVLR
jgi:PIN domain nuclease of toxin-antitoxin system